MSKALETGKSLADLILAKLPENLRDQAKTMFAAPEATDALTLLGDSALARTDYSKNMDDLTRSKDDLKKQQDTLADDYEKLNTWFADKKGKLEEYDTLKAKAGTPDPPLHKPNGNDPPPLDPSKFISKDDFLKSMNEQQLMAANYLGLQNLLTLKHFKDFGEVLDTRELLTDTQLGKQKPDGATYGILDAYQTKFSAKLSERDQLLETTRINKLVDEQVSVRMKGLPNQPFPLKGSPSALDLLEPGVTYKPEDYTAQAAADEYIRLQQTRGA